jgi:2-C-methyl-D-erythritol 4-phosphate cytidylyltransferase
VTVWVVVVAAGDGARFGGLKQWAEIDGRSLVEWSLEAARSVADGVVLVLRADAVEAGTPHSHGVEAVPLDADVIVVHDGARPLASPALFRAVVDAVVAGAAGAVPGLAVADTVKRVDDAGSVVSTVDRHGLVTVQTPQAFRADVLRRAHDGAGEAHDDAGLAEAQGATVRVVPGEPRNLKVTTPADLDTARALARPTP